MQVNKVIQDLELNKVIADHDFVMQLKKKLFSFEDLS
jgi:hypothetical protein